MDRAPFGYGLLDDNPDYRKQIANALMGPSTADVRNALTNTVTERASLLPLATYGDGTTRLAMPGWANDLWELASLQRRPDPTQGDALLLGGAAGVGGAIPSTYGPSMVVKGYHGTRTAPRFFNGESNSHFPDLYMTGSRAADDKMLANRYANRNAGYDADSAVIATEARFKNPMEHDARGSKFDAIPFEGRKVVPEDIAYYAKDKGHDGLIIRNVIDPPQASQPALMGDTVVALRPGTVFDDYGRQIYSNPISAIAAALMYGQDQ